MKTLLALERIQSLPRLRSDVSRLASVCARAPEAQRQLLVDVSVLRTRDAGTGIQRVTKALLGELMKAPPQGYVVKLVHASAWRRYRYIDQATDSPVVSARSGDVFLGLDLSSRLVPRHRLQLLTWKMTGARICFVMYDLLPATHPVWFTRRNTGAHRQWLRTIAVHADLVLCISRSVALDFKTWLSGHGFDPRTMPAISWFNLGTERFRSSSSRTDPRVASIAQRPFILMVGTIEPRKGYAPTLDAFEVAWQEDCQVQLVIVGRPGWKARRLIARLRAHPESGRRLHWFDDADDATLLSLYDAASGVLVASEAEGFGLPILEAALHQKPLLVRDIPVFREIAAEGAAYFSENTSTQFAKDIKRWIRDVENGTAPKSSTIPLRTWTQSANEAMAILTAVNSSATTGIESPVSMVHTVNMS